MEHRVGTVFIGLQALLSCKMLSSHLDCDGLGSVVADINKNGKATNRVHVSVLSTQKCQELESITVKGVRAQCTK